MTLHILLLVFLLEAMLSLCGNPKEDQLSMIQSDFKMQSGSGRHTVESKQQEVARRLFLSTLKSWAGCETPKSQATKESFANIYDENIWQSKALSGSGSEYANVKPFADYLLKFITEHNVTSIAEVSAGHWPSGWQPHVKWPHIAYHGVDIVPSVVEQDKQLLAQNTDNFGFQSASFSAGDMACDSLPAADLLLTKDTLQHLSFNYIRKFLAKNIQIHPPKYKYVMVVNDPLQTSEENSDIGNGDYRHFQLDSAPFNLPAITVFEWTADQTKIVQLLTLE